MYETTYHRATSLADAAERLAASDDGRLLAGGHTLIPTMKQRLAAPSDLIDISGLSELKGISRAGDVLTIGAATCHADVAASGEVRGAVPALAELAGEIGDPAVRNRGTLGGSVANNDPAADYPAAVLALDGTIVTNSREIAAADFFAGLFETALAEHEIVTAVRFAVPERAAYRRFPNPASRYPMAAAFVARFADGGVRVGVTGASQDGAYRWAQAEAALAANFDAGALAGLAVDEASMLADIHGSAAYRANLVAVMTRRAVAAIA